MGSRRLTTASAFAWLAVTSAPTVTSVRPIRPSIGVVIVVRSRSILAELRAARAEAISARVCLAAATVSS
jgi:hypothetical protein